MAIGFISDLHLSPTHANTVALFDHLLEQTRWLERLYILGDLFDLWLGDSISLPSHQLIVEKISKFNAPVPKIYLLTGNRDFLLQTAFFNSSGCIAISDPYAVDIYGESVLLTHGDLLCTDDKAYLRYRAIVRHPWVLQGYYYLPRSAQQWLGEKIRTYSQQSNFKHITDINLDTLKKYFKQYQVSTIIHGHTHLPAMHLLRHEQSWQWHYVLSDWEHQGQLLLWHPNQRPEMHYFTEQDDLLSYSTIPTT